MPVYGVVLWQPSRFGWLAAIVVNLVTHPVVWLALSPGTGAVCWAFVEGVAWIAEFCLILLRLRRPMAHLLAAAILANALSALAGVLLLS